MTHIEALSHGDAVKLELVAVKEFPALDSSALDKVVQYHCMATFDHVPPPFTSSFSVLITVPNPILQAFSQKSGFSNNSNSLMFPH